MTTGLLAAIAFTTLLSGAVGWVGVGANYAVREDARHHLHESRLNRYVDVLWRALGLNSAKWYKTINPFLLAKEFFVGKNAHEDLKAETTYLMEQYGAVEFNVERLKQHGFTDRSLREIILDPNAKFEVRTRPNSLLRQKKNNVSEYEARHIEETVGQMKHAVVGLGERLRLVEETAMRLRGIHGPLNSSAHIGLDAVENGRLPDFEDTWAPVLADYFNNVEDIVKAVGMLRDLEQSKEMNKLAQEGRTLSGWKAWRLKRNIEKRTREVDRKTLADAGLPPLENHGKRRGRH